DEHGIIYIDDYYCEDFDCKKATDEFISSREENKLVRINRFGISLLKNNVQMHDFSSLLSEKINSIEFNSFRESMEHLHNLNKTNLQSINCIGIDYEKNYSPKGIKFYFGYFDSIGPSTEKLLTFLPNTDLL